VSATRRTLLGTGLFVLAGPVLEAGVGPFLVTRLVNPAGGWPDALRIVGIVLIALGLAALVAVLWRFPAEGHGTPSPTLPARHLIVGGAYRHVRHPMYVATATILAGEALAFAQPVLLACAAVYLAALAALSRLREEPLLHERFGAEYAAYRAAVPGWWPRLRPYRP